MQEIVSELQDTAFPEGITLLSLATHTSGLPRVPDNMLHLLTEHPLNPYAYYMEQDLMQFLTTYSANPPSPGREAFEYSNLGAGLLGCSSMFPVVCIISHRNASVSFCQSC